MLSTRPKSYVPVDWGVKAKQSVLGKPELLNVEFCNVTDHSVLFIFSEETFSLETKYFLLGGISVTVGVVAGLVGGKAKSGVSKIYTKIQKQVNLPEQRFHVMPGGGIRVKIRWGGFNGVTAITKWNGAWCVVHYQNKQIENSDRTIHFMDKHYDKVSKVVPRNDRKKERSSMKKPSEKKNSSGYSKSPYYKVGGEFNGDSESSRSVSLTNRLGAGDP